jgi:hypothetical protein
MKWKIGFVALAVLCALILASKIPTCTKAHGLHGADGRFVSGYVCR